MSRMNGQIERYCRNCGVWFSTDSTGKPLPNTDDLVSCPKCGEKQRTARCNRCDYEWQLHRTNYPAHCPKCKTPYYNTKRIQDRTNVAKKFDEKEE